MLFLFCAFIILFLAHCAPSLFEPVGESFDIADCAEAQLVDTSSPDSTVATEAELETAIAKGGTIRLSASFTVTREHILSGTTVIDGNSNTLIGAGTNRFFTVDESASATFQRLTLTGGRAATEASHFSGKCGGAVLAKKGATVRFISCTFISNTQTLLENDLRGGAVYLFGVSEGYFANCTFIANDGCNGGAIGGLGSDVVVYGTTFTDNNALGSGSGLKGHGGAISLDGVDQYGKNAVLSVSRSHFTGNTAGNMGGAVYYVFHKPGDSGYVKASVATFTRSSFTSNTSAAAQGGALYAQECDTTISQSSFFANTSPSSGGGVWFYSATGALRVINTTFYSNSATNTSGMGGGAAIAKGCALFLHTTFAWNHAPFHAGGIQAGSDLDVGVRNSLFYNNTSTRDWAVYHANRTLTEGGGNIEYIASNLTEGMKVKSDPVTEESRVADPLLGAYADNGGVTKTMALESGSGAIDAGVTEGAPSYDQRDVSRGKNVPDCGAYEVEYSIP